MGKQSLALCVCNVPWFLIREAERWGKELLVEYGSRGLGVEDIGLGDGVYLFIYLVS